MGNCAGTRSVVDQSPFSRRSHAHRSNSFKRDPNETILSKATDGVDEEVDALVSHISGILKKAKGLPSSNGGSASLKVKLLDSPNLCRLREFLSDSSRHASELKEVLSTNDREHLRNAAGKVLEGIRKSHWIAAGVLVVAMVVEDLDSITLNKLECMELVEEMYRLSKHLKNLKQKRSSSSEYMKARLEESVRMLFQGAIVCFSQMQSSWLHNLIGSSITKERVYNIRRELDNLYSFWLKREGIQLSRHKLLPRDAVGIEETVNKVMELLELDSEKNVVAVILHGFGGIGKSTIAEAVYASVDADEYRYCKVPFFEYNDTKPRLTKIQKSILDQIAEPSQEWEEPSSPTEGQMALLYRFKEQACFIFIDNALQVEELSKLMPKQLFKAKKLRLLITARNMNVREGLDLYYSRDSKLFEVTPLNRKNSLALLKGELGEDYNQIEPEDIEFFLKIAGGVPLVLEYIGRYIRMEPDKRKACNIIRDEYDRDSDLSFGGKRIDIFTFAFDSLHEEYKESFLDICTFFLGWPWSTVKKILGEDTMEVLRRRSLIKMQPYELDSEVSIDCEEYAAVQVHEVMLECGKRKVRSQSSRITKPRHLTNLLHRYLLKDALLRVKGIALEEPGADDDMCTLPAENLDTMASSLRIFSTRFLKIEGNCRERFRKLIFFESAESEPVIDMEILPNLKFFRFSPTKSLKIPPTVRVLCLDLSDICNKVTMPTIPDSVESLLILGSGSSSQIPEQFLPGLASLQEFQHSSELPEPSHYLNRLRELWIHDCKNLKKLPKYFENCSSLTVLELQDCEGLEQLPEEIHHLQSLEVLRVTGSKAIKELPLKFAQLSSLRFLDLHSSENLHQLCDSFHLLSSLELLDLRGCRELEGKWLEELLKMNALKAVEIKDCPKLIKTWETTKKGDMGTKFKY